MRKKVPLDFWIKRDSAEPRRKSVRARLSALTERRDGEQSEELMAEDRFARGLKNRRQIAIIVVGRLRADGLPCPSGSFLKKICCGCCRCTVQRRSGIATCLRTRP